MVHFDEAAATALKNYKYSGEDRSYLYVYVLTPMNKFLVEFIPLWIAPNVLTISGLLVSLITNFIVAFYCPTLTELLTPSYSYLFIVLALFYYQTIDNLDGRQARRTNSSSPLGLLIDHGCDALTVTISGLSLSSVFQTGIDWPLLALISVGFWTFVFATWEEYYTGSLILGRINGPSDGQLLAMLFTLMQFIRPGIWAEKIHAIINVNDLIGEKWGNIIGDYKMNMLIVAFVAIAAPISISSNIRRTLHFKSFFSGPFQLLFPFLYLNGLMWYMAFTPLSSSSPSTLFSLYPRFFVFAYGFYFAESICKLMIAHVIHKPYKIPKSLLIPALIMISIKIEAINKIIMPYNNNYQLYIAILFIVGFLSWLYFAVTAVRGISAILKIHPFKIPYPIKKQQ